MAHVVVVPSMQADLLQLNMPPRGARSTYSK